MLFAHFFTTAAQPSDDHGAEARRNLDGEANDQLYSPFGLSSSLDQPRAQRGADKASAQSEATLAQWELAAARTLVREDAHEVGTAMLHEIREPAKAAALLPIAGIAPALPTVFAYLSGALVWLARDSVSTTSSLARSRPPRRAMNRALHMHAHFRSS